MARSLPQKSRCAADCVNGFGKYSQTWRTNDNKSGPIPHTPDATFVSPLSFFIFFPTSKTTKLHLLTFTTQGNYCRAAEFALRNHRRGPKSVFTTEPDWLLKNVTRTYTERRKKIKRFPKISVNNSSRVHAPTSIGRP